MDDRTYFYRRAEQQLKLAERCTDASAARAHFALAARYLERVCEGLDQRSDVAPTDGPV